MMNINHSAEIEFNIDEILLHGFRSIDRTRLSQAFNQELNNLLSQSGADLNINQNSAWSLDAGQLSLTGLESSEQLGVEIAQSIFNSVSTVQASVAVTAQLPPLQNSSAIAPIDDVRGAGQ